MFSFFKRSRPNNHDLLLSLSADTTSGQAVNSQTAQALPAVHCAISVLSEAVASLPVHVYQQTNDVRTRAQNHHIERLLNQAPNHNGMTAYDFKLALIRSMLLRGNAYARIEYDGTGKPNQLTLLHPDSVIIRKDNQRLLGYQIALETGKFANLLKEEVLHLKYHTDDGIEGKSPIQICREAIGLGLAQQEHGARLFKNGVKPSGVFETDSMFKDENSIKRLKDSLSDAHSGTSNTGKILLLEQGLKFKPISLSNQDAEWLAARNFSVVDVARMFKLSPIFLQDYTNSTYANFTEASRAFLGQTLRPLLTNIQQEFSNKLLSDRYRTNTIIEFNTADLLRANSTERYEVYDAAIRNGVMSPNEVRRSENMPPREGGDEFSQSWIQKGQSVQDGGS
ncbi:phage portal protein [Glaciecola petra]|uniref:Phage portal protein n=1 Tax=Glaciecola petra TaxID=3075602 RepID=A0ABU2ZQK6_9ALTE|nr:phage portal protein [Aestuariibacter sp. P117]MDT0594551.1 phage portal protein [Aestuariibacter sp. P117]